METFTEEKQEPSEGKKLSRIVSIAVTLPIYIGFFILGACVAMPGLTLPELQEQVNTSFGNMAYIYTVKSGFYLFGCFLGGVLLEHWNQPILMCFAFVVSALSMSLVPWCPTLIVLLVCMGLTGLAGGFADTGNNVMIIAIWGDKSGPFVQALHFLFGVGAFAGSVIVQPFTEEKLVGESSFFELATWGNGTSLIDKKGVTYLQAVYPLVGEMSLIVALSFLAFMKTKSFKSTSKSEISDQRNIPTSYVVVFISLLSMFLVVYSGLENDFGQFVLTFAMNSELQMSKIVASYVTAVFWGSFAVGRFLAIFFAKIFAAEKILIIDKITCAVASSLTLFANHFAWALWIGAALNGIGQASMYSTEQKNYGDTRLKWPYPFAARPFHHRESCDRTFYQSAAKHICAPISAYFQFAQLYYLLLFMWVPTYLVAKQEIRLFYAFFRGM